MAVVLGAAAANGGGRQDRIGLVLEQPILDRADDPWQIGAYDGLARAKRRFDVVPKAVVPKPVAPTPRALPVPCTRGYLGLFEYLAAHRYDLVMGLGTCETDAVSRAARSYRHVHFALLDGARTRDMPTNVEGTYFHTEQSAYLAGFVAASLADTTKSHVVSSVGGYELPTVEASIAGFEAGAKHADPDIGLRHVFTNSFTDQQPCRNAAQNQIAQGSEVVFDVAGRCGIGALKAARKAGRWGIGVDIDQSYLGRSVLTSALKNLNLAVVRLAGLVVHDRLHTGGNLNFDLQNHGVGLAPLSSKVPAALRRQLDRQVKKLRAQIESGAIDVPTKFSP